VLSSAVKVTHSGYLYAGLFSFLYFVLGSLFLDKYSHYYQIDSYMNHTTNHLIDNNSDNNVYLDLVIGQQCRVIIDLLHSH
jgi:hypothetical protein